jgi:xylan 1,4-beta-xylosidase
VTATQPGIPGCYPDPSICRVGDTYYVVNSSFEYLPGLPLHASKDLVTWTPIGNALTRVSQIAEHEGAPSSGIYAPTIRHHDGKFWIVCTNILDLGGGLGHFIVSADDPAGPWSDPVHVAGTVGIDPDLMWDDAETCRLTWKSFSPDLQGIVSAPIDPSTGTLLAPPTRLWQGTGMAHAEGPHLYQIDGWWYLLLAEGGTERGHTANIARARSLDGPFDAAPANPILTHRSTSHQVQNVGHADLVECADGTWAAVHLGVRPQGPNPGFHLLGRETFVVGIDWLEGWPVVDETRFQDEPEDHLFVDDFTNAPLDQRWLGVGQFPESFTRPERISGRIIDSTLNTPGKPMLATRVRDLEWSAEVQFDASVGAGKFVVRIDDDHEYGLRFDGVAVESQLTIGQVVHTVGRVAVLPASAPILRISAHLAEAGPYGAKQADLIELAVVTEDGTAQILGEYDGRYLSSEVAGGFTGRVVGVQSLSGQITLRHFCYATKARR